MITDNELKNNNIGSAIQYYREAYYISQGQLCKGLCSSATLSRIESGKRDVDALLLEALLERLGNTPNLFELILTDYDYILYKSRQDIGKQIEAKNFDTALRLLNNYERISHTKGSVHKQFIVASKALINELQDEAAEKILGLYMEAISYTIPNFKTNIIEDNYLSSNEFNIIINIIQQLIITGMIDKAKEILFQTLDYYESRSFIRKNVSLYTRVAIIACKLFIQEQNYNKALEICNKGLEITNSSLKLDYLGELIYLKAQITEAIMKKQNKWVLKKNECLKLYLQAFYVFDFLEMDIIKDKLKKYLQEEYKWVCIV